MFCRNCGNAMADNAAACVKCGGAAGTVTGMIWTGSIPVDGRGVPLKD